MLAAPTLTPARPHVACNRSSILDEIAEPGANLRVWQRSVPAVALADSDGTRGATFPTNW